MRRSSLLVGLALAAAVQPLAHDGLAAGTDGGGATIQADRRPYAWLRRFNLPAVIVGEQRLIAAAFDDVGVVRVVFYVDGVEIATDADGSDAWSILWDSTGVADGSHELSVVAVDTAGQSSAQAGYTVTVGNVDLAPAVAFASPAPGETVSDRVTLVAQASDDRGIVKVSFAVDGVPVGTDLDGGDGWSVDWQTDASANGSRTLEATATDTGSQTASAFVNVTVDNPEPPPAADFETVAAQDWTETAVRKVLMDFAYGGHASDQQIADWAAMGPDAAIGEMLTFDAVNASLSPPEDASSQFAGSLQELQDFWSTSDADNPVPADALGDYTLLKDSGRASRANLANSWMQASTTRGVNPFLHKVAFYLTNYLMAVSFERVPVPLMRQYYDEIMEALIAGDSLTEVIAVAASSAAVTRQYGHDRSRFASGRFIGSDDFAREFHQLFFRIQGETEDQGYHEQVTIEGTALLLTGMGIDKVPDAYGSADEFDWWVGPIDFTDHVDPSGRELLNSSFHHGDCLEILNDGAGTPNVCGADAEQKVFALASLAGAHPESLDNLPVHIAGHFGDDNLTEDKMAAIRGAWHGNESADLLAFLRAYAISTAFHRADRVKFRSAFARNLLIHNLTALTNEETFARHQLPTWRSVLQGGTPFMPAHVVFGGQTGLDAADSSHVFGTAYRHNADNMGFLAEFTADYTDNAGSARTWSKDWGAVIPADAAGAYVVADVAAWLWQRYIADGGKNLDPIIRAQLHAILATGLDFGYVVSLVDPAADPNAAYGSAQILDPLGKLKTIDDALAAKTMALASSDPTAREAANWRVGQAINLITLTPYMFAQEGR